MPPTQPPPPAARHVAAPKTAFITGVSSGIGRAIAERLLAENHRVWGTSRDVSRLAGLAQKFPATFTPVALDLDNPDAAIAAFEQAAMGSAGVSPADEGRPDPRQNLRPDQGQGAGRALSARETRALPMFDLVINNAGYGGAFSPFTETDFATWRRQIDTMLATTARLAHTALRAMMACNRGCLVNVSSLAVNFPLPYMSAYNTAKAGLSALNESLIFETRGTNVTIIDFRPADYRTDFNNIMRPGASNPPATTPATGAAAPTPHSALRAPHSRDKVAQVWRALDTMFNTAPLPDRAARDLLRAIARGRSGTVCSGRFFQARVAPLAARLLPSTLMRSLQARYFGAT